MKRDNRFIFRVGLAVLLTATALSIRSQAQVAPTAVVKNGIEVDLRSDSKVFLDEFRAGGGVIPVVDEPTATPGLPVVSPIQFRGGNLQVNDPGLDTIQIFTGFRPFVHFTESETSLAAFGRNIVATYNTSAGAHLIPNPSGPGLVFDRIQFSGFSTSNDGGNTFHSGFFPGVDGDVFTFGDPSVDVDRHGNFFFAQLGETPDGAHGAITVNASHDGGTTWANAVIAAVDDDSDKEWLAVGPDPFDKSRDNVYVTWTSFQSTGQKLMFAKSTDGGVTWASKLIFAPAADPIDANPQNSLQASNPVVDRFTGTLYVPFLHFSNADTDFIQMLISNDGGASFHFATFNAPGAPDATLQPLVQPGELIECGATRQKSGRFAVNARLTIHAGPNIGGSITGLARFVNATRLIPQPSIAARNGQLFLAWPTSDSRFFGDPAGHSNIMFTRSDDGGATWTSPLQVNPPGDPHHVEPSLTLDEGNAQSVHISYYTQHSDGSVDVDLANSHDRGNSFPAARTLRVSSASFALPPTNIPIPSAAQPFATTNYDRVIAQCYALGEYQSAKAVNGNVYVEWGDSRNNVKQPVNALDPISGVTHPQTDVFFQIVKAQ